jgi:hypothetical protein
MFKTLNLHYILTTNFTRPCVDLNIMYEKKTVEEVGKSNFISMQMDYNCSWKTHIEYVIIELSFTCYVMRTLCHS